MEVKVPLVQKDCHSAGRREHVSRGWEQFVDSTVMVLEKTLML
jgi:hypothetical protein